MTRVHPVEYIRGNVLGKDYLNDVFYLSKGQPDADEYYYKEDFDGRPIKEVKVFDREQNKIIKKKLCIVDLEWGYEFEGGIE